MTPAEMCDLAVSDPERLHAFIADPATDFADLTWAAEYLGARWAPDRWWSTLRALLRHPTITVREAAMGALCGEQTDHEVPAGFYDGRDWPADAGPQRDEILADLERIAEDATEHSIIREQATATALQLRTGERWPDAP